MRAIQPANRKELAHEGLFSSQLDADELAGLQAMGLIPDHACEVVGLQDAADSLLAALEMQAHTALGGAIQ